MCCWQSVSNTARENRRGVHALRRNGASVPIRRAWVTIAWRWRSLAAGRHDRAIVEWRETIRLAPTSWSARIGLADALLADGDAGEAATQCREVLKQKPGAVEAIVILGAALAAEGQAEEAIPQLERALELEPDNARAHFHLGLALYDRGRSQSAVAHLNEAIRLQPDDVSMLWQTAWILATSADPSVRDGARAVELARRAIQLSDGQERAPSMHSPPRWPKPRSSPRPSTQPSKRRRLRWPATIPRWPTPSSSGLASTVRACPIASRRRLCRPGMHRAAETRCSSKYPTCLRGWLLTPSPVVESGDTNLSHTAGRGGGSLARSGNRLGFRPRRISLRKPHWQPSMTALRASRSAFPTSSNSSRPADRRARAYWVWAICGFLLLAVGLVFGQTVRHEFLGVRRRWYSCTRIRTLLPD